MLLDNIAEDPIFRSEFQEMCRKIGVDPLASRKGFWGELLGVGDFYYELGILCIEICILTRSSNGGLISLKQLRNEIQQRRKLDKISNDDIRIAISKISVLGGGFRVMNVRSNSTKKVNSNGDRERDEGAMVVSVPTELNPDQTLILSRAQDSSSGSLEHNEIVSMLGESQDRAHHTLKTLLQEGMLWVDYILEKDGKTVRSTYYVPSIWSEKRI